MSTMGSLGAPRSAHRYRYWWLLNHGGTLLAACFLLTGCGNVNMDAVVKTLLGQSDGVGDQAADSNGLDPKSLEGKSLAEVKATLGVPQGKLRTQDGEVWLYSEWRVQFDEKDAVISVQPETAVKLQPVAEATAARQVRPITVVAQGGRQVDLQRLMPPGKVTIVDFYADWCGPCRRISPHLERLASSDPDVVLVKVDIVNWGTPVTRQFGINSVPNVRVFDRRARAIGQPTSSFTAVQRFVSQAKRT